MSYIELAQNRRRDDLDRRQRESTPRDERPKHAIRIGGWFIEPTVIEGLSHDCRTNQEEIFGPVVTIMPFDTEDEVLGYANSVRYGLSSTIWTENLSRAHRVAAKIESGIVWVNCWLLRDLRTPFGGVKDSGVGREGGFEALRFFTEEKNVCIKLSEPPA